MFLKKCLTILQKRIFTAKHIDESLTEKVRLYALTTLSFERYEHSLRVAKMAKDLCQIYGENKTLGYFAGLSHDICKEMDKDFLIKMVLNHKCAISNTETKKPSLLHGKACAIMLKTKFLVFNKDILEAVECHTFGKKNMGNIAKIVCIADKIEPGRPYMSSLKTKNLLKLNLDTLLKTVLQEIISVRESKNENVFPEALWVLD